jgi:prevent-host-death family protein
MTRHVPISEFKDHASELVAAAENGEEIVITRHGKPAVLLGPIKAPERDPQIAAAAMERILARREAMRANGMTATAEEWIAWKNEGQR